MSYLIDKSATELVTMIKAQKVTAVAVAQAFIDQILAVNSSINAIRDGAVPDNQVKCPRIHCLICECHDFG